MATNAHSVGRHVDVKVTGSVVASGALTRNNGIIGIPMVHGLVGQTVAFAVEGVHELTLNIGGTLAAGTYLYWDTSAAAVSIGAAADDFPLGQIVGAAPTATRYYVLLAKQPTFPNGQNQA